MGNERTPRTAAAELREHLALLGAPAMEQAHWINSVAKFLLPPDDLLITLDDMIPSWLAYLRRDHVISPQMEGRLLALRDFVVDRPADLWRDDDMTLFDPAWEAIR